MAYLLASQKENILSLKTSNEAMKINGTSFYFYYFFFRTRTGL
jgi:hypothetical protein